ncbi:type 1 fimbrial protein [Citrobacter freundii]|nr:type 1 fimbrial protein [Citrobacter freundii]MBC6509516.1 type 1 fimbrial protein [Citrobacter freundii]
MKITIRYTINLLLLMGTLLFSLHSMATCSTVNQYVVQIPLRTPTLSAGAEFPVGSVIMRQRVRGFANVTLTCEGSAYPSAVFSLTGGTLYPGQSNIYQTGISGLGVRFRQVYDNRYYPYTAASLNSSTIIFSTDSYLSFDIEFVKMGPVTAGIINSALFPRVEVNGTDTSQTVRVAWHTITGTAVIQTPSCTTPNFNWSLGTTSTTALKSPGDASAWVDTPVTLTGCSTFSGNNINGSYTQYTISGFTSGTTTQPGNIAPNKLTMTLTPNTSAVDAANGIVALDNTSTASGFGVQVASKQSGTYIAQDLSGSIVVEPTVGDSSGTVSFPLGARIIRTSDTVQGGSVSASLTYTISYQ